MSPPQRTPVYLRRFLVLWENLDAHGDPVSVANNLLARWSEPHRHYHTLAHLEACLTSLDAHRSLADDAAAIEAALWFHDAIYDPRALDNETRSAVLAVSALHNARVPAAIVTKVERLILSTRAHQADGDPDTALLLDIDLSILGAEPKTYDAYAADIRREYSWVPAPDYRAKRAAILTRFLQRPRLFLTAPFFNRFESNARENLAREIQQLSHRSA